MHTRIEKSNCYMNVVIVLVHCTKQTFCVVPAISLRNVTLKVHKSLLLIDQQLRRNNQEFHCCGDGASGRRCNPHSLHDIEPWVACSTLVLHRGQRVGECHRLDGGAARMVYSFVHSQCELEACSTNGRASAAGSRASGTLRTVYCFAFFFEVSVDDDIFEVLMVLWIEVVLLR